MKYTDMQGNCTGCGESIQCRCPQLKEIDSTKLDSIIRQLYELNETIHMHYTGKQIRPTINEMMIINTELGTRIKELREIQNGHG